MDPGSTDWVWDNKKLVIPEFFCQCQLAEKYPESISQSITYKNKMNYYTYILASKKYGTLYIGVTNNLLRRIYEHKFTNTNKFTHKHNIKRLVYYEKYCDIFDAISREKELKKWKRQWKITLINEDNPDWLDLCYDMIADDYEFEDWSNL